ncbi:MAG: epoxyqueuosine reductase [Candidatus Methanofastidiosum sp.]|nr:epoxyqueuosine reductase [Methanofastidiosum sp.]
MKNVNLKAEIISNANKLDLDFISVADAKGYLNQDYVGNKPQDIMKNCSSVIVFGVSIPKGAYDSLPKGRAEYTNTLLAATATLRIAGFRLAKLIEERGYSATLAPSEGSEFGYWYANKETLKANFSMKYACYLSGIGSYGKNHLIITDKFGSRVRMAAILTDAEIGADCQSKSLISEKCKNCYKCVETCPVSAFSIDGKIDRRKCREYMFGELGGLRCGMCVKVCPI